MTDFQKEQFLPVEPDEEINQSVEYLAARQPVQPVTSKDIKITPSNGGVFTKNSEFIEFRINPQHNTFLDGSQTSLNFTYTAKAAAQADSVAFTVYAAGGAMSLFKRLQVTVGGYELENITDHNRIFNILQPLYTNTEQTSSSSTINDFFSTKFNPTGGGRVVQGANDAPSLTPAQFPIDISVPLSLSSLFGPSARKAIPIGLMREAIMVRLYLVDNTNEAYYAATATAGTTSTLDPSSNFELKNASLECKCIRFDDRTFEYIRNNVPDNTLSWDSSTYICNNNNVAPQDANVQVLLGNTNYTDVKSIIFGTRYSSMVEGKTLTYESVFPGLFRSNVLINGQPVLARPLGVNNTTNLQASTPQIVANLISIARNGLDIFESNTALTGSATRGIGGTYINQVNWFSPYNNGGAIEATRYPILGPTSIPNNQGPWAAATAQEPISPAFFVWGVSLLNSQDTSRQLVGRNLVSKQVVVEMVKHNQIPAASLTQVMMSILSVGVKYHLDVKTGGLTRTL
jgi:hypothetical protein